MLRADCVLSSIQVYALHLRSVRANRQVIETPHLLPIKKSQIIEILLEHGCGVIAPEDPAIHLQRRHAKDAVGNGAIVVRPEPVFHLGRAGCLLDVLYAQLTGDRSQRRRPACSMR
jgi:hypothetical protein